MLAAQGDLIVFADADMATPPDQLPRLVHALESNDVALGAGSSPTVRTCEHRNRAFGGCRQAIRLAVESG